MDKAGIRRVQKAVVGILNEAWDPLGAASMGVMDEYDSYALTLTGMLVRGDPDTDLLAHLEWAESENMGLASFDRSRASKVVTALKLIPKISN